MMSVAVTPARPLPSATTFRQHCLQASRITLTNLNVLQTDASGSLILNSLNVPQTGAFGRLTLNKLNVLQTDASGSLTLNVLQTNASGSLTLNNLNVLQTNAPGSLTLTKINVLQTDASGSLEAVRSALGALPQDSVVLRYLLATPNDITVSDIDLAAASKGTVLGFNVEPSEAVLAAAKKQGTAPVTPLFGTLMSAFTVSCFSC